MMSIVPTDDALRELAGIAGIAPTNFPTFAENVRARIQSAWICHYIFVENGDEIFKGCISALEAMEASARHLLTSAREVALAMVALADTAQDIHRLTQSTDWRERRRFLEKCIDEASPQTAAAIDGKPSDESAKEKRFVDAVLFLAGLESPPIPHVPQRASRGRGRPPSVQLDGRRLLILGLLDDVDSACGRLSFNKNCETNGTRALRALAPYLPKGFKVFPRDSAAGSYKEWNADKKQGGKIARPR